MFVLLTILFLVVPIVELYVIVQVAGSVGVLETIGLLILVSLLGAWLVKREGVGVMRKVQAQLARGELPTRELVDGLLILLAGALMLTPGFVTDALGVVLLVPPTRAGVRAVLIRRFRGRVQVVGSADHMGFGTIYDVRASEHRPAQRIDLERDDGPSDPPSLDR